MNRDYTGITTDDATFFIGKEIEHTPAYGKKTLFIVGRHPVGDIEHHIDNTIDHLFFGANHSFNPKRQDYAEWTEWEDMITYFLNLGYLCSLDIPLSAAEEFHDCGFNEHNNFIPQIRVPIPYIRLWNYNTMVKIDDIGFNSTNPGVWTHSLHDLQDRAKFTNWAEYKNDEVIKWQE